MILKIDLHTHTDRYSACARHSPETLCETALARGLDAIAITEHHHQWSPDEIAALQARYPPLKLYTGVEISCSDRHDYVILGLDAQPHAPNPMPYPQLKALLDAHPGTFTFVAHCFRYSDDERGLAERKIQGIEMASWNTLARLQPQEEPVALVREGLYRRWQRKMGWVPLYNSDAHSEKMVGTFYNLIEAPNGLPPDERGLVQMLRRATPRPFVDPARIRSAHMRGAQRRLAHAAIRTRR